MERSRVHPINLVKVQTPSPNLRPVKYNGFYCPWHFYQILAWLLGMSSIILFFTISISGLQNSYMAAGNALIGVLYSTITVLMIIATSVNPTDQVVVESK
jgi:hypothetical protein